MSRAVFYAMTTENTTERRPWLELIGKDITTKVVEMCTLAVRCVSTRNNCRPLKGFSLMSILLRVFEICPQITLLANYEQK